jgi:hypothetical protein
MDGSRTWFPYLPGVGQALVKLDLSPIEGASFVYVDCYQLIEAAAVRAAAEPSCPRPPVRDPVMMISLSSCSYRRGKSAMKLRA